MAARRKLASKKTHTVSLWQLVLVNPLLVCIFGLSVTHCTPYTQNPYEQKHLNGVPYYDQQELFGELLDLVGNNVEEGRTFSISNISLTITYITFVVALVMLGGFVWLAVNSTGGGGSGGSYGHYRRQIFVDGLSEWLPGSDYFSSFFDSSSYDRRKRSARSNLRDSAMASKLHMLDESFRKFEMDDIGCQMLLSCEAAQLETLKHPIYGSLTPKIHKLLSTTKMSRQSNAGQRIEKLMQAHREGRKHGASCKKLYGDLCHDIMNKLEKAENEDKEQTILSTSKLTEKTGENGKSEQIRKNDKEEKGNAEKKTFMSKLEMEKKYLQTKKKYRMKY